jgi:hypothetical protein
LALGRSIINVLTLVLDVQLGVEEEEGGGLAVVKDLPIEFGFENGLKKDRKDN